MIVFWPPIWHCCLLPSLPTRLFAAVRAGPGPRRLDSVLSAGYNHQPPSIVNFVLTQSKPAAPAAVSGAQPRWVSHVTWWQPTVFPATVPTLKPLSLPLYVCVGGNNNDYRPENGPNFKKCTQLFDTPAYNKWVNNTKAVLLNIYHPFVDSIISPRGWHYFVTTCDCYQARPDPPPPLTAAPHLVTLREAAGSPCVRDCISCKNC